MGVSQRANGPRSTLVADSASSPFKRCLDRRRRFSGRGRSAGLERKMRRSRSCQSGSGWRIDRAEVSGQRQCRCRGRRRSRRQLNQCADWAIRIEGSVRLVDRSACTRSTGSIRHGRRRRLGRSPRELIEMQVTERQDQLDRQREQRQAGTPAYVRPEPVHLARSRPFGRQSGLAGPCSRLPSPEMGRHVKCMTVNGRRQRARDFTPIENSGPTRPG